MSAAVVLLWLAIAPVGDARAEPNDDAPTVAARVDKSQARVGDPVELTIATVGPTETPVNLPASLDLSPFAVLERRQDEQVLGDGRMRRQFVLSVAAYEPGETAVPAVEVTYLGRSGDVQTVRTEPIPFKVESLLANEPEPALKDNAPPVMVVERKLLAVYVAAGVALATLGALAALTMRRRLRARVAARPPPPPRQPHEIALERLDRLGASGFEGGDYRPFYFELSEIIREYLGARYGFESLELTTEELVQRLGKYAGRDLVMGEVEGWLAGCDLVKFARISSSPTEVRGALETAIRIVGSTRPRPEPAGGQEAASG